MSDNGKMSAYPVLPPIDASGIGSAGGYPYPEGGLTKRELIAAMAMQGFCAHFGDDHQSHETTAACALRMADALLAELEKTNDH